MTPLLSRNGSVLGYLNDVSPHRKEIRSRKNSLLGWFNPVQNMTFNASGKTISNKGDLRASLLSKSR
jgi:hypothetical protein